MHLKGEEHKKYEFGNKVSIVVSIRWVILGGLSFRNEYHGHTIEWSLEKVRRLTGRVPELLAGDPGYRGQKRSGDTRIVIPGPPLVKKSCGERDKKRKLFNQRAGIEPRIGHLKTDHRLGRNFYKGITGDRNVMLAAAGYNIKRAMSLLLCIIRKLLFWSQPTLKIPSANYINSISCLNHAY